MLLAICSSYVFAQCTNVPVEEAVRNGDFEAGYLSGSGTKHTFTAGSDFDFYSDMDFKGQNISSAGNGCHYGMGDGYAVARAENFTCASTNWVNTTYWGMSYGGDANFKDHTPGKAGKGYALLVDLNNRQTSPKTGGKPIAWEQKASIYPSQNYWFSAYIANFSNGTAPQMQVVVIPELAGVADNANKVTLPVTTTPAGLMQWTQMSAKWSPVGIYDKVTIRFEFVNSSGGSGGLDAAIDDISFINSCQNLAAGNAYTPDFQLPDTINLCTQSGSNITLDPHVSVGQQGNASIYWFSGTANPQTQTNTGVWSKTVSTTGVYRVCIDDPDNDCSVNDKVVLIENLSLNLPDLELCSPSSYAVDCGITTPTIGVSFVAWSGASGTGSGKTYTVNKAGVHTLLVNSAVGHNCNVTEAFNVISKLPTAPTNLEYCDGGGTATNLIVGDGKSYKWSTSQTMAPVIGTGVSVPWTPAGGTTGDQTLWIQNATTTSAGTMSGPTITNSQGAGAYTTNITAHQAINIKTAKMGVENWTGSCAGGGGTSNVTVQLLDASNAVVLTKTVAVPCGSAGDVTLDINVPAGNYKLKATGGGNLFTTAVWSGTGSTYSLAGYIDVTGYSSHYGAFGQMVIEKSEACDPIPVIVKAKSCCTKPTDNPLIDQALSTLSVCTPNKATIVTKALTNGLDYKWQVSHNNGATWADSAGTTGVIAGGKATLANVSANGWYRIVIANTGNLAKSCVKNSDSAIVIIKPLPTAITVTVNPNQTSFCKGVAHTLTGSATVVGGGAISYQWKYDGTGAATTTPGLTTVGTHNYKVIATANGCVDSSAMKTITINPLPDSSINALGSYCGDVSAAVNLTAVTAGGSWKVDNVALGGSSFVPKNYSTGMHFVEYDVTANSCSSDDTVQFHIIKKDTADITAAGPFCKNAAAVTLKAVNTGGTWSGAGITSVTVGTFNPKNAAVGSNTITYTIAGTCGDTKTRNITVNATDSAKINTVGAMCSSSPAITLSTYLTAGSTTGGTWSGTGISNASTGAFDPSSLAQSTYKIKYVTGGVCPTADSVNISITNGVNISFLGTQKITYCKNSPMDTIKVSQLLSGGVFKTKSGKGIVDATNGYYNPSLADVGADSIFYEKAGLCGDTIKIAITVNAIDIVQINAEGVFCQSDLAKQLTVTAGSAAGTWSASCGVCISSGGLFNPSTAGATAGLTPAYHTITYTTNGTCKSVDTIHVTVVAQMVSEILNADTTVCKNGTAFKVRLSNNSTSGGTWLSSPLGKVDNAGNFNPVTAGQGVFTIYYGIQGATLLCSAIDSVKITVTAIDTAKITLGQGPFCLNDPALLLAKETVTSVGTWSGIGISNAATGEFTPATAGVGPHLITYTTTGGCPVTDTLTVTVVNQMIANITTPNSTKCKNAAAFTIALSGTTTAGGVWSSIPTGKVDNTGSVNPATAGVGVFWAYYGLTGATSTCSAKDSVEITVTAIDTAKITLGQGPFCLNDPAQTLLKEAASNAGTWSGTGITSGAAGTFNPTTAGVGSHKITYTTSGTCPVFDTLTIGVVNQMVANITTIDNTSICVDQGLYQVALSGNSTAGGTWSSVPVGLVNNAGKFNPQLAGVSTGVKVLYSVSGATATCSAKDSVLLNVLPREEAQITNGATKSFCTNDAAFQFTPLNAGGTWAGTGVTAGGLFTPSVAGSGGPYTIRYKVNGTSGLCADEDTIMVTVIAPKNASINASGPYCENLGLQNLSPVITGGTFSGVGVSAGGSFNPAAAGAGAHWIKYTQTGQCPSVDSIEIVVVPLPEVKPIPDVVGGCVPLAVNFGDSSTSASQIATWNFGDGAQTTLTSSNASISHTYTKVGVFDIWLEMQFTNGCKDSAQTKVTITEVPVADFSFSPQPASTLDPRVLFTNQSTGATDYLWDFGSKGTPSSSVNADDIVKFAIDSAVAHGYDSIPVKLKASNAVCTDSMIKKILLKDIFTMYAPNAFSPNGDGLNELFYPMGANHECETCTNYEFMVFNRWGEMVFRTTTPYEPWNGKRANNLHDAQIDVYIWRVVYTDSFTGKEGKQMGTVTLMR